MVGKADSGVAVAEGIFDGGLRRDISIMDEVVVNECMASNLALL